MADLVGTTKFSPNKESPNGKDIFYLTHEQIVKAVRSQCCRAEQESLPATLTVEQWLFVLNHFEGKCAYCRKRQGLLIEHFIPISLGGGTTMGNCVPSCYSCNSKKGKSDPSSVTKMSDEVLDEIRSWLAHFEVSSF